MFIRLDEFVKALKSQDGVLAEFNEELWGEHGRSHYGRERKGASSQVQGWDGDIDSGIKLGGNASCFGRDCFLLKRV